MKPKIPFYLLLVLVISFLFSNCSKEEIIPEDVEINNFVWGGMNAYYKWQGEVEDLADTRFSTRDELNQYLSSFEMPDELFNSLVYENENQTSFITDDFTIIENAFDGIKLTTGMKVNGMISVDSNEFYLYVYDVIDGSNAQSQGVTRGMIITEVNGTRVTLANVESLLDNVSFSISIADYNDGNPEIPASGAIVINLTKSELQENPIKIFKTFDIGSSKTGYLLYNRFTSAFDGELNSIFDTFKSDALDNLIIDLRYNGGGSIETATYLASMITGQFENEVFSRQVWNDKVMSNVVNQNLTNFFTDEIDNGIINETINSLGLTTVYFIVSDATANTSEVLINGLKKYTDVKLIGTRTLGLTEASLTVYDSDNYTKTGGNFNSSHTWALQPIVLEVQNADNINQPNGHVVDLELFEDPNNLGVLGDVSDPVLFNTLEYIISGTIPTVETVNPVTTQNLWNSNMTFLEYNRMYVRLLN